VPTIAETMAELETAEAPSGAAASRALATHVFDDEVLDREAESEPRHTSHDTDAPPFSRFSPIDIEAVITSDLKAAGLMRGR
jgi:hypothetical protein